MNPPESKSPRHVEGICRSCVEYLHQWAQKRADVDAGPWGLLCREHFEGLCGPPIPGVVMPDGEEVPF